ncbi:MAG TPA: hypothetical protein VFX59_25245 [Polyangiales bacterium]|nr:hypothetical protein [Polyangiales bacterium]
MLKRTWLASLLVLCATTAFAQNADDERIPDPSEVEAAPGPQNDRLGDEQALQEERFQKEQFRDTTDPYEDPAKRYAFLGVRWSFMSLPPALLKAYTVKEANTVSNTKSFAAELSFRRKGFQVTGSLGFMRLKARGPFQLKSDPLEDTEWLQADFKLLNLTTAITWSTTFADWFSIEYGLEAGIGFLFGDLIRSEAYKRTNGTWGKCPTWASQTTNEDDLTKFNPNFPGTPTREQRQYCQIPDGPSGQIPPDSNTSDMDGEQYDQKAKKGLFNKGVPHAIPILGPRLSLRFKPIHQVVIRVDVPLPILPFGIVGGVAAQYGF